MAKNTKRRRSFRTRMRAFRRRRTPKRFSILTLAGMGAGAFTTLTPGDNVGIAPQVIGAIQGQKSWEDVPRVLLRETLGYDYLYKTWNIPAFTSFTLLGAAGSKVAGKFVRPSTFDAIPYIGKKIKL